MTAIEMARFGAVAAARAPEHARPSSIPPARLAGSVSVGQRKQPIDEAISSFYDTLPPRKSDPRSPPCPTSSWRRWSAALRKWRSDIDRRITEKSEHWRLERMPAVDRNILRLAIYEMSELKTPAPVVIDEALELARQFSGDESVSFINGVLDAVQPRRHK